MEVKDFDAEERRGVYRGRKEEEGTLNKEKQVKDPEKKRI